MTIGATLRKIIKDHEEAVAKLEAENERLREALESITELDVGGDDGRQVVAAIGIASAALEDEP